jgi:YD repeat-containing protein
VPGPVHAHERTSVRVTTWLTALAEPGGSCPATLVFPNTTKCTGFTNDDTNRRTGTTYPNGVKNTTVYDNVGGSPPSPRPTPARPSCSSVTYTTNGTAPARDGSLRKTMTTESLTVTTYGYDAMQRLTSAVTGAVTEAWTYDANGNRLTAAKSANPNIRMPR